MLNNQTRVYSSRTLASAGTWLTFLAVSLAVNEKYGPNHVAFSLLIQSLPPLLLSPFIGKLIPPHRYRSVFVWGSVLAGINIGVLALQESLIHLYVYFVVASILSALTTPLFFALLSSWVKKEEFEETHTRISAIQPIMLSLAPPLGGIFSTLIGKEGLFIFAALLFLGSVLALPMNQDSVARRPHALPVRPGRNVSFEKHLDPSTRSAVWQWYLFLCAGAALNALEFAAFKHQELTSAEVGFVLGAWGFGHLLIFAWGRRFQRLISTVSWGLILVVGFTAFLFSSTVSLSIVSFIVAGAANAVLAGQLRARIHSSLSPEISSLSVWALINGRTALINAIFYGGVGFMLPLAPLYSLNLVFVFFGALFAIGLSILAVETNSPVRVESRKSRKQGTRL